MGIEVTSSTLTRAELSVLRGKAKRYAEEGHTILAIMYFLAESTKCSVSMCIPDDKYLLSVERMN